MKRYLAPLAFVLVGALVLSGCGPSPSQQAGSTAATVTSPAADQQHQDSTHQSHQTEQAKPGSYTIYPAYAETANLKKRADGTFEAAYTMSKDGYKEFRLTAMPVKWKNQQGQEVEAWTYNGVVPGPQIRVQQGDKVRLILTNKLPEATTLHHHGLPLPYNMDGVGHDPAQLVQPGKTFTYAYTVTQEPGTEMYHAHTNTIKQSPMGLFGMYIVEAQTKPQANEKEFTMMLSDGPLGFLINGKSFPETAPFQVKVGDRVKIRIANIGNMNHPMHLHGGDFKIIATDGHPVPAAAQLTKDTVDVAPGERYDIEFTAKQEGGWVFHCHVLSHVYTGTGEHTGMIQVIDVKK